MTREQAIVICHDNHVCPQHLQRMEYLTIAEFAGWKCARCYDMELEIREKQISKAIAVLKEKE